MTKEEVIKQFDPNGHGVTGNLFGLPFSIEHAELVVIPVPWEVTVSYHTGTAKAPHAILQASRQVDLAVREIPDAWKLGIGMLPVSLELYEESSKLRELSSKHIHAMEAGEKFSAENPVVSKVNEGCENLNVYIKSITQQFLQQGKMVALLGGDHSTPLGFFRALAERINRFGILQIDAHADLRKAYEGFTYSHASIMYNALKLPAVGRLVQVGIRDYCDEELRVMKNSMGRVVTFFDDDLHTQMHSGKLWANICDEIIQQLPQNVYISFDIDGLNPGFCPNTGTPVPGGLDYNQAVYLIKKVVTSGRIIIGFDLNEVGVGNTDWDANVGARLLYILCNCMAVSQGRLVSNFKSQISN
jgi:agmatinase